VQRSYCGLLLLMVFLVTLHPLAASVLSANITGNTSVPNLWTYTLFNTEPVSSPNYVDQFSIAIGATVTVTAEPTGWDYEIGLVSGINSITWFSNDMSTDLAPNSSLGGFTLSSPGSSNVLGTVDVNSWDHTNNIPGPNSVAFQVGSPSSTDPVPEPWTGSTVGMALLTGSLWLRKKSRRNDAKCN